MKLSNIKKYKSSVLGLGLIILGSYLLIQEITFDYYILGSLFFTGLGLLFSGDEFIQKVEKYVFGKILFEDDEKPVE